jgi:hypothetical protein
MDLLQHPLTQSLIEAGSLDPYLNLPFCDPDQAGWCAATDLLINDDARLKELVTSYGYASWGTDNYHVAGSAFIIAYLTRVIYPVIGQYVLHRRVPRATLENLAFHRQGESIDATGLRQPQFAALPDDPAASHPDAEVLKNERDLYQKLKKWVFTANLDIIIKTLVRSASASPKVSQNAVAAACAQAFHRLFYLLEDKDSVIRDADTFFKDSSSPIYGQISMEIIEHQGKAGLFGRRAGCCLIWRTKAGDGYCANCILQPKEEQTQRFKEMIATGR